MVSLACYLARRIPILNWSPESKGHTAVTAMKISRFFINQYCGFISLFMKRNLFCCIYTFYVCFIAVFAECMENVESYNYRLLSNQLAVVCIVSQLQPSLWLYSVRVVYCSCHCQVVITDPVNWMTFCNLYMPPNYKISFLLVCFQQAWCFSFISMILYNNFSIIIFHLFFYLQLFELMLTIVGNTRLRKVWFRVFLLYFFADSVLLYHCFDLWFSLLQVVGSNIRELVYYTIAFLQMTEQQVYHFLLFSILLFIFAFILLSSI